MLGGRRVCADHPTSSLKLQVSCGWCRNLGLIAMTAVVIPLPIRPNPNSLTQCDLGEITAKSRGLSGPWVIEVATKRDEPNRPDEVSVYLFLRRVSDTEPCFIIRRIGHMIRVTARDDSAAGIKSCATLGDFQT